jgi:hypothetical protein
MELEGVLQAAGEVEYRLHPAAMAAVHARALAALMDSLVGETAKEE